MTPARAVDASRAAAFLDRDGVINRECHYLHRADDFEFLPGAIDAMRRLREASYLLVVVTNQSGIGRGYYTEDEYQAVTNHMTSSLAAAGVDLAAVLHCPHHPEATIAAYRTACDCRKPLPGMLTRARQQLGLAMNRSILIGDKASDVEAGRAAGVGHCFLVRSGHALTATAAACADGVHDDLATCVDHLLAGELS